MRVMDTDRIHEEAVREASNDAYYSMFQLSDKISFAGATRAVYFTLCILTLTVLVTSVLAGYLRGDIATVSIGGVFVVGAISLLSGIATHLTGSKHRNLIRERNSISEYTYQLSADDFTNIREYFDIDDEYVRVSNLIYMLSAINRFTHAQAIILHRKSKEGSL